MDNPDLSSVGNHFFLGLQPTSSLSDKDKHLLAAIRPAGVILFKSNFLHDVEYDEWLENQCRLVIDIKTAIGRDKFLIAIDHEGARVCRTPHPVTRFTSASEWASKAGEVGRAMGRELSSIGINMNFAPVMDIHTNPLNPVIAERAFGSTPNHVGECGVDFIEGIQSQNVWACPKHFPGHGDTDVDSHHALPVLNAGEDDLWRRELLPFKAAIGHGAEMIMTAHIMFPQIDPDLPATLSKRITSGLLREKLGFGGVVVSDDIGMHAMDDYFSSGETSRQFIEAGNDMLMVCAHFTDTDRAIRLASSLKDALQDDEFRELFHQPSSDRVKRLLQRTRMNDVERLPDDIFEQHRTIAGVYKAKTVEVV